uniref:Uncharacterized protein n=1 Tax=Oryza meridionalis TaxID=40149 RepID=A0A0E0E162_9ORYZ
MRPLLSSRRWRPTPARIRRPAALPRGIRLPSPPLPSLPRSGRGEGCQRWCGRWKGGSGSGRCGCRRRRRGQEQRPWPSPLPQTTTMTMRRRRRRRWILAKRGASPGNCYTTIASALD